MDVVEAMRTFHFSVTYDYRCPFARNAHEHIITALRSGAPWEVEFLPFSLSQMYVDEGGTPIWEDAAKSRDLIAVEASEVVRAREPEHFMDLHLALFAARHDEGRDIRAKAVLRDVLEASGIAADEVFEAISEGWPREAFRKVHESAVTDHKVFGVPTFITDHDAIFARIMTRPSGDVGASRATIERVLELMLEHPELNELKHTTIPR